MSGDVDAKVGVYYVSNSGAPGEIAEAALALLRGEDYVPVADRKTIAVEPKVLDTYVGEYELTAEFVFSVTREGGKLLLQQGVAPTKVELLATAPGKFVMLDGTGVIFRKNGAGVVDTLILDSSGQTMPFLKRPAVAAGGGGVRR
jgi:hypothetical protein